MRLAILISASCAALSLCVTSAFAQNESDALKAICDQAAANAWDLTRPAGVPGVANNKMDAKIAISACEAAAKVAPDDPRIAYQLGRSYLTVKAYESARAQFEKAA